MAGLSAKTERERSKVPCRSRLGRSSASASSPYIIPALLLLPRALRARHLPGAGRSRVGER